MLNIQYSTFNTQRSMKNSKTLHALILTAALIFISASLASAFTINIFPSKDNTLYEYDTAEGDHSNGAGFHFFAGVRSMSELRRGVLAFDRSEERRVGK